MKRSEALPVKQEIEAFSLKEDGEMNASDLKSYYAEMPELQFHQMMQDMDFFAQEFSDPIFGFADTFDTLIRDYSGDPESEIHARTSIQSAELAESEWLYNIGVGESDCSSDSGQITPEDYDSEASNSEYYSCEEEDGSNQVLGKFNEVENVLNLLHEVAQSPTVQSFADFVPECVVPFYEPETAKGTVLFDEGVAINEDQNVGNSELCKETNPSFDTEESHTIDLSSTSPIETYDKSILECGYEDNAFWSILTDTVVYHGENNLSSLIFDFDKSYNTTVNQTYITDPKDLYFNADNNNVPNFLKYSETGKGEPGGHGPDSQILNSQEDNTHRQTFKSKQEYFMAVHCNEPELNQRYPVKTTIQNKFDPIQCVTTTHLWSNRSAKPLPRLENKGLFEMGKISFKIDSTLQGKLLDDKQR